jgi:hypothetical protein
MNRHKCTIVIVLALLLVAWAWTGKTPADGGPAVEAQSPATLRQKEMHDRQMKGLAVCVVAVFIISGVSWGLNLYNKQRKRKALLERKQARDDAELRQQVLQYYDLPALPAPSEPPAGYW